MRKLIRGGRGQEEIAGFAIIIIVVAVILVVFLSFSLRKPSQDIQSYQADSFVQSFLAYTTECSKTYETDYLSIRQLIEACSNNEICLDERDSCEVLNLTSQNIIKESWNIQEGSFIKGYNLDITYSGKTILSLKEGNMTNNYKSSIQSLPDRIDIKFRVYN